MREMLRKAAKLLWDHPKVLLPFLIAELFEISISYSHFSIVSKIVNWAIGYHLLPGQGRESGSADTLFLLIAQFFYFLTMCLFTSALVGTSTLTAATLQSDSPSFGDSMTEIFRRRKGIVLNSLKLFALYECISGVAFFVAALFLLDDPKGMEGVAAGWTVTIVTFSEGVLFAWVLTPSLMRLITKPALLGKKSVRDGRLLAVFSYIVSWFAGYPIQWAEHVYIVRHPIQLGHNLIALEFLHEIVRKSPLALFFVALTLLARPEARIAADQPFEGMVATTR